MAAATVPEHFLQTHVPVPNFVVRWRRATLATLDGLSWIAGVAIAALVLSPGASMQFVAAIAGGAAGMQLLFGVSRDLYLGRHRIGSRDEQTLLLSSWLLSTLTLELALVTRPSAGAALVLGAPMAGLAMIGVRQIWWMVSEHYRLLQSNDDRTRVLVFGAGDTGAEMVRAMLTDPLSPYLPVGIIDDDPYKSKRRLCGVAVVGNRSTIAARAESLDASILLIAIRTASAALVMEVDELGRHAGLDIRVVPTTAEMMGQLSVGDIRELTEADLLGRAEVDVDLPSILDYIAGKRVLVTGAGGSIGSELARQLHQLGPSDLIMLDRDETALHSVQLSIEGKALLDDPHLVVADIRDAERMREVFARWKPQVVFHAAALKHLTLLELHPGEAVKTNTLGTRNLLEAATDVGCSHFVNVSSDKAADPTSVLGATKLLAERETARFAAETGRKYVSVRFGNVLGSRGSVLPTFRQQIELGGPITVTHPGVTRYFMTIPEAVRLVLQAGAIGRPGEVLILDMGSPVKILDLAQQLIDHSGTDVEIVFTGLRPGEKMHEILVAASECVEHREHKRITHTRSELPTGTLDVHALLQARDTEGILSVGRGYVSLPAAIRAVEDGFDILGFDTSKAKVDTLNRNKSFVNVKLVGNNVEIL